MLCAFPPVVVRTERVGVGWRRIEVGASWGKPRRMGVDWLGWGGALVYGHLHALTTPELCRLLVHNSVSFSL